MKLADQILYHLMFDLKNGSDILLPNFYYNDFEMDLFRLVSSGFIYEYEIKISKADFKNDFNKSHKWKKYLKHDKIKEGKHCNRFFFVTPKDLIDKSEVPDYAGLIYLKRDKYFETIKPAKLLHHNKYKLEDYKKLAESLSYREYNLRYKLNKLKKPN